MKPLSDFFKKAQIYFIQAEYGIKTIEQAQELTDEQLLKCRHVGKVTIDRFRRKYPHPKDPSVLEKIKSLQEQVEYWAGIATAMTKEIRRMQETINSIQK